MANYNGELHLNGSSSMSCTADLLPRRTQYSNKQIGYWGNSSLFLYSPKIEDHPSVVPGDASYLNVLFCSEFKIVPEIEADTGDGYISGLADRNIFIPKPVTIKGPVTQLMLAHADGSPDFTLARIYEHCRHLWAGYGLTTSGDGSGTHGIPGSVTSPQFSIFSDLFGVFSNCLVNSIEFRANANEQVSITHDIVAQKVWPEDAPTVRTLLNTLSDDIEVKMPMQQVWSYDCSLLCGTSVEGDYENSDMIGDFALPSSSSSQFLSGYNTPLTPGNDHIVNMSLKIDNFLQPMFTMKSRKRWDDRTSRDEEVHLRYKENMFVKDWAQSSPRLISGEITWVTDAGPHQIFQKILGTSSNQIIFDPLQDSNVGQDVIFAFGPMKIKISHPIWSFGGYEMSPEDMLKVTVRLQGATDGELVLQPTERWI